MGKTIKYCIFFFFLFFIGYRAFLYYSTNYSLASISYEWPEQKLWYPNSLIIKNSDFLEEVFKQPFHYYSQGNQSYAFISRDGLYILKFFKFSHLQPPRWFKWVPDISFLKNYKLNKILSQTNRLKRLYKGHWIAEIYNKENCGIFASNMIDTNLFPCDFKIAVFDRLGRIHSINPKQTPFILQKKAIVTRSAFNKYLKNNDLENVKSLIDKIFTLYLNEYQKGVYDRDHNVIDNIGFVEDQAMRIDVGKLQYDPNYSKKENYLPDLKEKVIKRINIWVQSHYPMHFLTISNYLDLKFESLSEGNQKHVSYIKKISKIGSSTRLSCSYWERNFFSHTNYTYSI